MSSLSGQVALVTGAAQGIGKAIADHFRELGAKVVTLDRTPGACDITCDLSDVASLDAVWQLCPDETSILVNSAGVCFTRPLEGIELETAELTFQVNVLAPLMLSKAFAERRVGKQGVILNIASNSAFMPKLEQIEYGASKAALVSITKSLALSLGPRGIRVNAIAPGVIDTPLTSAIAKQRAEIRGITPEETLAPVLAGLPLRRMGQPHEIANLAGFLCSDQASLITGQTYVADGGQWMN